MTKPAATSATIDYDTADGTATAPSDYAPASGTLTFAPGETSQTVSVSSNRRHTSSPCDWSSDVCSSALGATVADGQGLGTIENDDPAPTLSIDDVSVAEG